MTHVSPHLSLRELACEDGTAYPQVFLEDSRAARLAAVFEAIRAACGGRPIRILSAYRSPSHNRNVGGARNSQHVRGRALDLAPPAGMTVEAFHQAITRLARTELPEIRGIGRYRTFVHVDIPAATRLAVWNGGAAVKDARAA